MDRDGTAVAAGAGPDDDGAADARAAPTTLELLPPQPVTHVATAAASAAAGRRERVSRVMAPPLVKLNVTP
jgi:hypothetical protein